MSALEDMVRNTAPQLKDGYLSLSLTQSAQGRKSEALGLKPLLSESWAPGQNRFADPPLSQKGEEQVLALTEHPLLVSLARQLKAMESSASKPTVILESSPMFRALLTAQPLREMFGLESIRIEPDIHESGGLFKYNEKHESYGEAGLSAAGILKVEPAADVRALPTEGGWYTYNCKEPFDATLRRVLATANRIRDIAMKNTSMEPMYLILVSHGTFMDYLINTLIHAANSKQVSRLLTESLHAPNLTSFRPCFGLLVEPDN